LRRALLSVFSQTLLPTEVTVIDDGSTDDTSTMLRKEFPEVNYYYQENLGVSSTTKSWHTPHNGDWIAFLDSDDEWLPEKLIRQTAALSANPESRICHTEEIWIRNGVRVNPPQNMPKKGGWIFTQCLPLCAMSPSTIMIHRSDI